jgi:hypothetical protein
MVVGCLIDVELNNLCTWVCTFGSVIISLALFGEINKLPLDPVNLAHMIFFFLFFPINVSNLRNFKLKMTECVARPLPMKVRLFSSMPNLSINCQVRVVR